MTSDLLLPNPVLHCAIELPQTVDTEFLMIKHSKYKLTLPKCQGNLCSSSMTWANPPWLPKSTEKYGKPLGT